MQLLSCLRTYVCRFHLSAMTAFVAMHVCLSDCHDVMSVMICVFPQHVIAPEGGGWVSPHPSVALSVLPPDLLNYQGTLAAGGEADLDSHKA